MTVRLHCFGESGNAYKAALTLSLAGIDWAPVFVDFFNGGARRPEFLALNEMGEVPVLETGEAVLTQSGVIQLWAAERGAGALAGTTPAERDEVLRWMFFDNHKVSGVAGGLRYNMNFLPAERRSPEIDGFLAARLKAALRTLESRLAARDWLATDRITCADIACAGYLFYPEPFTFDRADWPAIDRWLDRIAAQPGWKRPYDMMPGRPSDRA